MCVVVVSYSTWVNDERVSCQIFVSDALNNRHSPIGWMANIIISVPTS